MSPTLRERPFDKYGASEAEYKGVEAGGGRFLQMWAASSPVDLSSDLV